MARQLRTLPPNSVVHVVDRGNERRRLFEGPSEFEQFFELLDRSLGHCPLRLLAYALMPNRWHMVLWPQVGDDMSRFLHRLTTAHAARFRFLSGTAGAGHVYQGRYHSTVVRDHVQYVRTIRYVEANALSAGLVSRAEQWQWTSLAERLGQRRRIGDGPVVLPPAAEWANLVNASEESDRPRAR